MAEFHRLRNLPNHDILSNASFNSLPCAALKASVVDVEHKQLITLGKLFQLSLINFQLLPSNNTTCPSVEEAGQRTSQAHSPSSQSHTTKQ